MSEVLQKIKEIFQEVRVAPLRTCRKCGKQAWTIEDLDEFKKCHTSYYNREPICKKCWNLQTQEYAKKHRKEIREKHHEYMKHYYPEHRQERIKYAREYRERYPEKVRAHNEARDLSVGSSCEKCGSTENLLRHHPDYSRPKYVITLCRSCHFELHRGS